MHNHPLAIGLTPLLQDAVALATTLQLEEGQFADAYLLAWTFTPTGVFHDITDHTPTSAHQTLHLHTEASRIGTAIFDLLSTHGALAVGLRTLTIHIQSGAHGMAVTALVQGHKLLEDTPTRHNQGPDRCAQRIALYVQNMTGVAIPKGVPERYLVSATVIDAPDAASAVLLHVALRHSGIFHQWRWHKRPLPATLTVAKIITNDGASLVDNARPPETP